MKKLFLLLSLAFLPIASVLAATGYATVDGIRYYYDTDAQKATIVEPEQNVETIGGETFYESTKYGGAIVIPYQVKITVSRTIYTCKVIVGNDVFDDCGDITSVDIDVEKVGTWFQNNWGITKLTMGSHVKSIASEAFYNCAAMTTAQIPQNVTSIGASAFAECQNLQTLTFSSRSQLTSIGQEAFANTALTKLTLPSTVTSIGTGAFKDCKYLTTLSLPENLTTINAQAFQNCIRLTNLTIPSNVKYIRDQAFQDCSSITSLVIPDNVITLGKQAFSGCEELSSLTIGSKIRTIGNGAFENCKALTKVNIPNTVLTIGDNAFSECTNITELNIGSSVKTIGDCAFYKCTGLTKVTLPKNLTTLGAAFQKCTGITYMDIPQNVTSIASYAFSGCSSLAAISLGAKVAEIGSYAFSGCEDLKKIYCSATTPPTADGSIFHNAPAGLCTLYVPKSSLSAYRSATAWKNLGSIKEISYLINGLYYYLDDDALTAEVTFPRETYSGNVSIYSTVTYDGKTYTVKSIGENAFKGFSGVTSVSITSSVETIGNEAFYGCSGLTSFDLKSVKVVGANAFYNCTGLTTLNIFYDNNLTTIGEFAFARCESLKEVSIPMNVTSIGRGAFSGCTGMTRFGHHTNCVITEIAEGQLSGCSSLDIVYVPRTVTTIGKNAYANCTNVREVNMYEGLKEIGESAFSGCTNLYSVTIPNSVETIGTSAFKGSGLITVTIGSESSSNLSHVKSQAFANCTKLKEVNCLAKNVVNYTASDAFSGSSVASATLKVPFGYTANYKSKTPWSGFGNIIEKTYYADGMYYLLEFDELTASVGINPNQYKGNLNIPEGVTYGGRDFVVTGIGWRAFADNTELNTVVIPATVTSVGDEAFKGCTGLSWDIYSYAEEAPVGSDNVFSGVDISKMTLFVPYGSKTKYKPHAPWNSFGDIEEMGLNINDIYYYLNDKKSTAEVTVKPGQYSGAVDIPKSITSNGKEYTVTTIGGNAFETCAGLTSVTIPESVITIGKNAFKDCTGLTSVTLPEELVTISPYAFAGCTGLTTMVIPESVTTIGQYAFSGCTNIGSVNIPQKVTTIENYTFKECSSLTEMTIHDDVKYINEGAFYMCSGLTTMRLGHGVKIIGNLAFAKCGGLNDFYILAKEVPQTETNAFEDSYIQLVMLYVPEGCKPIYEAVVPWSLFDEINEMIVPGDLNGDSYVNEEDVALLAKVIMGEVTVEDLEDRADLNEDTHVNAADLVILINKLK